MDFVTVTLAPPSIVSLLNGFGATVRVLAPALRWTVITIFVYSLTRGRVRVILPPVVSANTLPSTDDKNVEAVIMRFCLAMPDAWLIAVFIRRWDTVDAIATCDASTFCDGMGKTL